MRKGMAVVAGCVAATGLATVGGKAALAAPHQAGGALTFLAAGDVDYLDPGQTYYTFGYMVSSAVHRSLYGYTPDDGANAVPDLAAAAPEIAANRRSLTVRLRPGVRYAPPVNREVVAGDVKYAIERAFSRNVANGYANAYFSVIKGTPSRPTKGVKRIRGVQVVDAHTLRFQLKRAAGDTFAAALALPITAPVPPGYAKRFDRKSPSTYDGKPAFSGPYVVAARRPGRVIRLVRNPNWDPATDFRPAAVDAITIEQGNDNLTTATRRTVSGSRTLCCDSGQPPVRVLDEIPAEQQARTPSGGTRWIALNTRVKPFNRRDVRRAVVAGMNRTALRDTRGGPAIGSVATHFLPPGIPGFDEAGGAAGFSDLDFLANPNGDAAVSAAYFKRAGFKSGRYTGKRALKVIATNAEPGRTTARVAARQLRRMGFKLRMRFVPQDVLYTRYCGVPRAQVAICPNVGWFKDYNDPETLLRPTFAGSEIRRAGNVNWSQLRVKGVDRAMARASRVAAGPERNAAWAGVDKLVSAEAPGIPYSWDDTINVRSADVNAVVNPFTTTWDLSFTSVG